MYKCPICGSTHLTTHVIMKAEIEINAETGEVKDPNKIDSCIGIIDGPSDDNMYVCHECGYYADGKDFRSAETIEVPKAALEILLNTDFYEPKTVTKAHYILEDTIDKQDALNAIL